MAISKERKLEIIKTYGKHEKDTGLTEVQIALLTEQIKILSEHMLASKKDNHNKRNLLVNIAHRRKFLQYLQKEDFSRYKAIITKLNLRK